MRNLRPDSEPPSKPPIKALPSPSPVTRPVTLLTGCDLVPDLLRVDERAWFYVAEESGHLRAYASAPQLSLVR